MELSNILCCLDVCDTVIIERLHGHRPVSEAEGVCRLGQNSA